MSEGAQSTSSSETRSTPIDSVCDGIRKGMEAIFDAVIPPQQAMNHFREARIEVLRGIRAIIDHRIDRLSRRDTQGARVTVE